MTIEVAAECSHDLDVCDHANEHNTPAEFVFHEDGQLIGLTKDDLANDPFWQTRLEIAVGANRQERNWRTVPMSRGELVASLTEFKRGQKDGPCMTQGPLINGQRIAKNAVANHTIMIDCDTGEALDSLLAKVRALGLAAVLWTTYSHMKPATEIAEDRLVKLARDAKAPMPAADDQPGLVELAREYLASKKYDVAVLDSISAVEREHSEGGIKYVVAHAPMTRARVLLFLKEPYIFATKRPTQAQAIQDWKEAYAGVAEMLGVDYDQSCVDPSRLMYTPRIAPDASGRAPHEQGHEIIVIAGKPLDLDTVPRVKAGKGSKAASSNALLDAVPASGGNVSFKTPNILRATKYPDLDIVGFCDAHDELLSNTGEKAELTCPNEDRHTEQRADDRAFMVRSGETWWAGCQHATCKADSREDRVWYLDMLCQKYGATIDDVLMFSAEHQAEVEAAAEVEAESEKAKKASGDAFEAALAAIAGLRVVDGDVIANTCDLIVTKHPDDRTRQDGDANRLVEAAAGWTRRQIDVAMTEARKRDDRRRQANARARGGGAARQAADVPDDPASAVNIYRMWDEPTQCKVTQARWERLNTEAPTVYRLANGSIAQVSLAAIDKDGAPDPRFDAVTPADLTAVLSADMVDRAPAINFIVIDDDSGELRPQVPPPYVLTYLRGKAKSALKLPPLDRLQRVPVFVRSPAGEPYLLTKPGYDAGSGLYYAPPGDAKFYDTPTNPTADDVLDAIDIINDADRDIPYSDGYGEEPTDVNEPIYSGDVDADGHRLPNYERGPSSRANFRAMCLQPFVRNIVPGVCPQYHIDKPESGTGAGLLVDTFANITNLQERATVKTLPHADEEIRKTLLSFLIAGRPYAFIDNVQAAVTNPDLMAMLTAGVYSGRMLGGLTEVEVAVRLTMIMAGNNIPFQRDMLRRNVPILIDAETPNPESDRSAPNYFKHSRIWAHLRKPETRAGLIWAYQALVFNWLAKGCPRPKLAPVLGSFEEYTDVIGGILEVAGITGFMGNHAAYMSDRAGSDITPPQAVTMRIYEKYGFDEKTAKDLLEALAPKTVLRRLTEKAPTIDPELGLTLKGDGQDEGAMLQSLGHYISRWRTTFAMPDGVKVRWHKRKTNEGVLYSLREV